MNEFLKELKELLNKHNMEVGYYERQDCLYVENKTTGEKFWFANNEITVEGLENVLKEVK